MKIQQTPYYQSSHLLDTAERHTVPNGMKDAQKHSSKTKAVDVAISDEGINALRERVNGFEAESDGIKVRELKLQSTNEVAWEHYTAMRDMSSLTLKDGNYNVEDVMKSMMETYETLYNQIVKEHENGDRQVSYELTGKRSLTLEDDLAGLDEAFEMRLANLKGYITCQQTNKAFENPDSSWYFRRNSPQSKETIQDDYNYMDKEYQDTAISMMKLAREGFLALFDSTNYKKGVTTGILSDILNKNPNFMVKTKKLFS